MRPRTLWRNDVGFVTRSVDAFNLSPVYVTVTTARALIKKGAQVALPDGYEPEVLERIAWLTGEYGREQKISGRQAREIAQIARTLLSDHPHGIDPADGEVIQQMIEATTTEENNQ